VQTHPKRDSFELTILFPFFGLLSQGGVVGLCTKMNKKSVQILVQTGFEKTIFYVGLGASEVHAV